MKEYVKGDLKFIVSKNERNLYDYQSQEYSEICGVWVNMGKQKNFTKVCLEDFLDIIIDF